MAVSGLHTSCVHVFQCVLVMVARLGAHVLVESVRAGVVGRVCAHILHSALFYAIHHLLPSQLMFHSVSTTTTTTH